MVRVGRHGGLVDVVVTLPAAALVESAVLRLAGPQVSSQVVLHPVPMAAHDPAFSGLVADLRESFEVGLVTAMSLLHLDDRPELATRDQLDLVQLLRQLHHLPGDLDDLVTAEPVGDDVLHDDRVGRQASSLVLAFESCLGRPGDASEEPSNQAPRRFICLSFGVRRLLLGEISLDDLNEDLGLVDPALQHGEIGHVLFLLDRAGPKDLGDGLGQRIDGSVAVGVGLEGGQVLELSAELVGLVEELRERALAAPLGLLLLLGAVPCPAGVDVPHGVGAATDLLNFDFLDGASGPLVGVHGVLLPSMHVTAPLVGRTSGTVVMKEPASAVCLLTLLGYVTHVYLRLTS